MSSTSSTVDTAVTKARAERLTDYINIGRVVIAPVLLALVVWGFNQFSNNLERVAVKLESIDARSLADAHALSQRLTAIESNRFTVKDSVAIQETISQLWREVTERAKKDEVPPAWFKAQVDRIELELGKLRDQVNGGKGGSDP